MIDQSDQTKQLVNENITVLWTPHVHCSFHRRPPLDSILSRIGPFETLHPIFLMSVLKSSLRAHLIFIFGGENGVTPQQAPVL
jgi:hypothetical protein